MAGHVAQGPFDLAFHELTEGIDVASRPDPLRAPVHGNVTVIVNEADVVVIDSGSRAR